MTKQELAQALAMKLASEGIRVSDVDGFSFRIQLPVEKADGTQMDQVYLLTLSIPRDKEFSLAQNWGALQQQPDEDEGDEDEDEDKDKEPAFPED